MKKDVQTEKPVVKIQLGTFERILLMIACVLLAGVMAAVMYFNLPRIYRRNTANYSQSELYNTPR